MSSEEGSCTKLADRQGLSSDGRLDNYRKHSRICRSGPHRRSWRDHGGREYEPLG